MSLTKPVSKRLFIGSLPYHFTEGELLSIFITEGKVVSVKIVNNRWGRSRGMAYVEYENLGDAVKAKHKYHNWFLNDRTIIVDYAEPDPFLTEEGKLRHEESMEKHPKRREPQVFLPHPDSDVTDYRDQKKSLDNRQRPPERRQFSDRPSSFVPQTIQKKREYKGGKPVFNSLGRSINRNTTGEYTPKFYAESATPSKNKFKPRQGQKPEYKASSENHVRSTVFKQRSFGSKVGAKFAFKSKRQR